MEGRSRQKGSRLQAKRADWREGKLMEGRVRQREKTDGGKLKAKGAD